MGRVRDDEDEEVRHVRVLIAEDEALIRMDLREMLEEEGHEVVAEARDGAEAIALARATRPDLVFMDVKMPNVDGIQAARTISAESIAPVVMLTAFSQAGLVEEAAGAGAMAYVVKPFSRNDLLPAMQVAPAATPRWRPSSSRSATSRNASRRARCSIAPRGSSWRRA
jgi:two-component system, response regulator PdtaR